MTLKLEKLHCGQNMISGLSNSHKSTRTKPDIKMPGKIHSLADYSHQTVAHFSLYAADIRLYFAILDKIFKNDTWFTQHISIKVMFGTRLDGVMST